MTSTPTTGQATFRRVLVGTDGSDNAKRAVQTAIELAKRLGSELIIAHAIPPPTVPLSLPVAAPTATYGVAQQDYYKHWREAARKLTAAAVEQAKGDGVSARGEILDAPKSVVEQLVDFAKDGRLDLIIVGTRGLSGFRKLILGSISSGLVSHAPCAVLVVR